MLMWQIIFLSAIAATVAGFLYVGARVSEFVFIKKLAKGEKVKQRLCGFLLISLILSLLWLILDFVNAVNKEVTL